MPSIGQRLLLIVGMSTAWLPVLERLLYPVSFITGSKNDPTVYLLNVIYSIVTISLTLAVAIAVYRLERVSFPAKTEGAALLTTGLCATCGIFAIGAADVSSPQGSLIAAAGAILVALYFPLHFVFWSSRLARSPSGYALPDAVLSFALTSALFMLYGILDLRVVSLGAALPTLSAVLGFVCATQYKPSLEGSVKPATLWRMGMFTLCLILLLLCNVAIAYFNNSAVLHADMPYRWLSFCGDVAIALVIAALYLPGNKKRRPTMSAFSVTCLVFVSLLLVAVLMSGNLLQRGTIPLHCANAVLIMFGWLMIVRIANRQKLNLVAVMSFYLVFAVLIPRFLQAIIMYGPNYITMLSQSMDRVVVVALIVVFAVGLVLFALMKTAKAAIDDTLNAKGQICPPEKSAGRELANLSDEHLDAARRAAHHEIVLAALQRDVALSDREMDVARLALENYSAKKMASSLYVSVNTIYSHLKSIYRKTGVHSREEFIALIDSESSKL